MDNLSPDHIGEINNLLVNVLDIYSKEKNLSLVDSIVVGASVLMTLVHRHVPNSEQRLLEMLKFTKELADDWRQRTE